MANVALVSHLRLIAQLMALDNENHFKVRAFQNAADTIDEMSVDVSENDLWSIRGVGVSISEVIRQFLSMGTSARLVDLTHRWPVEALTMTRVAGVGPKTAMKLHNEGYRDFNALLAAAKAGRVDNPKLRQSILAAEGKMRVPFAAADRLAKYVSSQMIPHLVRAEVCGSLRRKLPDIKDIDIVGMIDNPSQAQRALREFAKLGEHIRSGEARGSIRTSRYGITMNCDLWLCTAVHWGSFLNHVTGSKEHNIHTRSLAKQKGMLINEYGIFKDNVRLGGEDEHDLYRILDIRYVEPRDRR